MKTTTKSLLTLVTTGLTLATLSACGSDGTSGSAPPRRTEDAADDQFALESGTYYIDEVWDVNDGCGRDPLSSSQPITSTSFTVANAGDGKVTIDRCLYDGTSTSGDILDNKGTLAVRHPGRRDTYGDRVAIFDQSCTMQVTLTANNELEGVFTETQAGRNAAIKEALGGGDTCSTSYKFSMMKR